MNISVQVFINDQNSSPTTFVHLADVPPNRTLSRILEDVQADYQRTEYGAGRYPQQIVGNRLIIVYDDPVKKNQREYVFPSSFSVHETTIALSDIEVPIGDDNEMRPLPNPNRKLSFKCVFTTAAHHANTTGFGSGFGSAGNNTNFNYSSGSGNNNNTGGSGWGTSASVANNNNNNAGGYSWGSSTMSGDHRR